MAGPTSDAPQVDTAEQISISSLALLKMLKHGASWPAHTLFRLPVAYMNLQISATYFKTLMHIHSHHMHMYRVLHRAMAFLLVGRHKWSTPATPKMMLSCTCVGRAGVPMEVMGLMLGEFVDDYTVKVVDVFAMPQSGTGVSVEAVDPVFQTKMLDMLKQCGR